jgi:ribosomal protein S18 acetylase RimI-like enzyme
LRVKSIDQSDLLEICRLHKLSFDKAHFTSVLPERLLQKYYEKIIEKCEYGIILYTPEGTGIGFAVGGKDLSGLINPFIKNNFFQLLWLLIMHPRFLIEKVRGVLSLIFKKQNIISEAEVILLSITTNPDLEMKGKGSAVLAEFEKLLTQFGINSYGLGVRRNNKKAIDFYLRQGFRLEFGERDSEYYIKHLKS